MDGRAWFETGTGAVLLGGRLHADAVVTVPDERFAHVYIAHVYIARGGASLEGAGPLVGGDAVRLTAAGARSLRAAGDGAEVLIWATD